MKTNRKVITIHFDKDGNLIDSFFKKNIIGEASSINEAVILAETKGFKVVDFEIPSNVPGELIDEDLDGIAVGVIST